MGTDGTEDSFGAAVERARRYLEQAGEELTEGKYIDRRQIAVLASVRKDTVEMWHHRTKHNSMRCPFPAADWTSLKAENGFADKPYWELATVVRWLFETRRRAPWMAVPTTS